MKLLIVHYHLRPGGVRRVIEVATPQPVVHRLERVRSVALATGEAPAPAWLRAFRKRLDHFGFQEALQLADAAGMPHVAERLGLDPTDAFAARHAVRRRNDAALTLLFPLARQGAASHKWAGVPRLLAAVGVKEEPKSATPVFLSTEFDSVKGRGGAEGKPLRKTPWGEIAWQLGGAKAFALLAEHEKTSTAPGGEVTLVLNRLN